VPNEQYARVPISALLRLDANGVQLYVALCAYARKDGVCWPSNAELSERTRQSSASVTRSMRQLVQNGYVETRGRAKRVIRVVPIESLSITTDRNESRLLITRDRFFRSPVINVSREQEVDSSRSLRSRVRDELDEGDDMQQTQPEQLFEIETSQTTEIERPAPIVHRCLDAFANEYGTQPISRQMIGRLARTFKQLSETYSDDELIAAAHALGSKRVANPSAVESFVLFMRTERAQQQSTSDGWSRLATHAFEHWQQSAV
jgi:DNA-binding transcriptional MocR family regulator